MQYDLLSRSTVKITLSEEDLCEYSLCTDNIALRSAETKRSLAKLLKRLKLFSGYKAERLFLEAFPCAGGGCILYVSSLSADGIAAEQSSLKRQEIMGVTQSLDRLIRLCTALSLLESKEKSIAYTDGRSYRVIFSVSKNEAEAAARIIAEYGEVCTDEIRICIAKERGRLICGDAIRKLSSLV